MKNKTVIAFIMALAMAGSVLMSGCGASDTAEVTEQVEAQVETQVAEAQPETETEAVTETESEAASEAETAELYTLSNLVLRAGASKDSDKLEIIPINTKIKVIEQGEEWCLVETDKQQGYVFAEYLTEDAAKAAQAEAEAKAKEAQEAAQEAAKSKSSSSSKKSDSKKSDSKKSDSKKSEEKSDDSSGERYEVSREKYDDCDGSGHGYYEITYSDGSVEIVEY